MPPRKGKNANYLRIKHVYLRVARGDFLERMGQQFLNYAGGAPKLYINRLGLLPDTHDTRIPNTNTYLCCVCSRWKLSGKRCFSRQRTDLSPCLDVFVSIVSGVGALTVIGMVVGCDQIVVAFVAGRKGADGSEAQEDIQAKLPLLAARCVALGIGMGILSLLPGHNIDSNGAIWLLGLAVVLLAISRIAEMGE